MAGRRRAAYFAVATVVTILFLAASYVSGTYIQRRVYVAIQRSMQTSIESVQRMMNAGVTWERVSPSVLSGLTIYGPTIATPDNGAAVTARRVTVGLNVVNIIRGRQDQRFSSFTFDSPTIFVGSSRGAEDFVRIVQTIRERRQPQRRVEFSFAGGTITINTDSHSLSAARVRGDVLFSGDTVQARIFGRAAGRENAGGVRGVARISAELSGARTFERFSTLLRIEDADTSVGSVSDQVWRVDRVRGGWNARKVEDGLPLDVQASWPSGENIVVSVRSQELRLADVFAPAPNAPPALARAFSQRASTDIAVEVAPDGSLAGASGWIATTLDDDALPGALPAEIEFSYDGKAWTVPRARLWGRRGTATFSGAGLTADRLISGTLHLADFAYGPAPPLTGAVSVNSRNGFHALRSPVLTVASSDLFALAVDVREGEYYDGSVTFSFDEAAQSSVAFDGRAAGVDDAYFTADLADVPVASVQRLIRDLGYEIPGAIPIDEFDTIDLASVIDLRDGAFEADLSRLLLRSDDGPDPFFAVSARITRDSVNIDSFAIRYGGYDATGRGLFHAASRGTVSVDTDFVVEGIPYAIRAVYDPSDSLLIYGDYGFTARLLWRPRGGVQMSGSLEETPIPGSPAAVTAAFSGLYTDSSNWFLTLFDVEVTDIPLPGADQRGSARLYVSINPDTVSIAVIELKDRFSTLSGTVESEYRLGGAPSAEAAVRLTSLKGIERYIATVRFDRGNWFVDAAIDGFPLRRVPGRFTRGRVNGRLLLEGPPEALTVRANVATEAAIWGDQDVSVAGTVAWSPEVATLRQFALGFGTQQLTVAAADLTASGTVSMSGRFTRRDRLTAVPFSFAARTAPAPRLSLQTLPSLPVTGEFQLLSDVPQVFSVQRTDGKTTLRRSDDAVLATLYDEGSFSARLTQPASIRGTVDGSITAGKVDVTVGALEADLPALVSDSSEVTVTDGIARGQLRVVGSANDPEFYGVFSITGAAAEAPFLPQGAGPFDAAIVVEERLARIRPATVPFGTALATVSGDILLAGGSIEEYQVRLDTQDEEGIHIVRRFGGVEVDGFARGGLVIGGTPVSTTISGDITVYRAQFAPGERDETAAVNERSVTVDLMMRSGRGVQFIWPNNEIPILRTNFATEQELHLKIDSAADAFSLNGDVQIQSGDIFYFDRNFLVREGVIQFQEDETQFDPRLTARAEIREAAPDGPVRIYLIADGEHLSEFAPRFESTPTLTNDEVVAILGGSIFQEAPDSSVTVSSALLAGSDIVTQFGVFRQFEESVRRRLDLDLFAVRTSVLQNILLTAITPTEEEAVPLTPSVGNYLNNTSVFMGRYIGNEVFGQFLLQMTSRDFEEIEREESPGVQRLGGVLIDSEFSLEWQTPFFLLEWTFAPREPEELFIRDNTFTFSWRFSY